MDLLLFPAAFFLEGTSSLVAATLFLVMER